MTEALVANLTLSQNINLSQIFFFSFFPSAIGFSGRERDFVHRSRYFLVLSAFKLYLSDFFKCCLNSYLRANTEQNIDANL